MIPEQKGKESKGSEGKGGIELFPGKPADSCGEGAEKKGGGDAERAGGKPWDGKAGKATGKDGEQPAQKDAAHVGQGMVGA